MSIFVIANNRGMKRSIAILTLALALTAQAFAQQTIPASDSRITWIGRTVADDAGGIRCDWSATYARIAFEGTELQMTASDTKRNFYNVWIDSPMAAEPDRIIVTEGEASPIVLVDKEWMKARYGRRIPSGHTVIIQKRTEGEQGITDIRSLTTDGSFLQAEGLKARCLEFIGDSYTCGYGIEDIRKEAPFKAETETSSKTYAAMLARYFEADYITVCHSGQGIVRNYNSADPAHNMPMRYTSALDTDGSFKWDASAYAFAPAMTVIYLGTNDFSTGMQPSYASFSANYITLIKQVKANYGAGHPVLCVAPKHDDLQLDYIRKIVGTCGLEAVYFCSMFTAVHIDDDEDLGASWHPNYNGQRKVAHALLPYISTITGWPLEDKTVK